MVARPKESLLSAAPGSASGTSASGGAMKKRKNRSSGPAPPKPAEEFDLNPSDWLFDSTKQLKEPGTGGSNPTDPLSGPKRHSRLRRTRSSARTSGKLAAAATADFAAEPAAGMRVGTATQAVADILAIDLPADREWSEVGDDDEDLDTPLSVRMARQSSGKRQKIGEPGFVSTAGKTGVKSTEGGAANRRSRLANSSKATEVENKAEHKAVEEEKVEEEKKPETQEEELDEIEDDYDMDVDEALATQQVQAEHKEPTPAPAPKPAPRARKQTKKKAAPPVAVRFSMRNLHPERPMLVHKGTPLVPIKSVSTARANGRAQVIPIPEAVRVNSPWNEPTPAATTAAGKSRRPGSAAPLTFTKPRVSFGGFAVHTASKPGGALVGGYGGGAGNVSTPTLPTTLKKVVVREKVPTSWSPRRWDSGSVENAAAAAPAGGASGSGGGSSQKLQTAGKPASQNQRRSRFGTQNDEEQTAAAARALEEAHQAEEPMTMPEEEEAEDVEMMEDVVADGEAEIPSFVPDSDDDDDASDEEAEEVEEEADDDEEEVESDESDKEEQENACENVKKPKKNGQNVDDGAAMKKKTRSITTARRAVACEEVETAPAAEIVEPEGKEDVVVAEIEAKKVEKKGSKDEQGPKHGFIAVTSTTSGVVALCKSAIQRLRGLRLCAEGKEDGTITHLIIGDERRTMKAMLAVANGAILLDPEWITASLEAGKWVPEGPYKSKVRFTAAADRARKQKVAAKKDLGLLSEHSIHIHPGQGNPAALKRVAMALGASITSLKECSVCVVSGRDGEKPKGVARQVPVVSEEWLLGAAETFKVPSMKKYIVR